MLQLTHTTAAPLPRYGIAALSVVLATLLTALLGPLGLSIPFALFFVAVVLSAWYGGMGPGLVATALSSLASSYFFLAPEHSLLPGLNQILQLGVFILVSVTISLLTASRRKAEEEARANEQWLTTTLRSIGDAVIATDERGRVTFMNPVAQELTGWTQEEAKGRELKDVFKIINEGTRREVESPAARVIREGVIVGLANHTLLIAKDGREIAIDDSGAPIKNDRGEVSGVILIFRDITERKRAEEVRFQLGAIVESSSDAILGKTLDGIITSWNAGAEMIYGYTASEAIGQPVSLIFPPDLYDELPQILERLKRGESVDHYETVRRRKDGKPIDVSLTISPIKNQAGVIVGASTIARDITERKRAQKRVDVQYAVTSVLAESATLEEAAPRLLQVICENLEWEWGALWSVDQGAGLLRCCGATWHVPSIEVADFETLSRKTTFARGVGLPGRIWASHEPAWIVDVTKDDNFPRAGVAGRVGLRAAFGLPIMLGHEVLGVMEFLSHEIRQPDEYLLKMMVTIGSQIGQFIERMRAEEALRASEERYRAFITQGAEAIWRFELDQPVSTDLPEDEQVEQFYRHGRLAECNDVMAKMYGFSEAKEIVGARLGDLLVRSDPQNEAFIRAFIRSGYRLNDAESYELDKEGQPKYFLNNLVGIIENGVMTRAWGTQRDITERKRAEEELQASEQRYRSLADAMPQIVWTARADGYFDYYNQRWFEYTGMTLEQTRGWGWQPVLHPDDVERCLRRWATAVKTGESYEIEHRFRRASDGTYRWHLGRGVPMRDEKGQIVKWFGTATDIDDQKRAVEERALLLKREQEARARAEEANRAKDEFLATLSHELRTPLTAMLGWTRMLRTRELDEATTAHALETIERNVRAQAQLIEDLLDVSRIITGKLRLDVSPVELLPVIEAAIDSVRPAADAKSIQIRTELDPLAGPVAGDPARLQQVVWNLVSNAVKFTPRGGRVEVHLERTKSSVEIGVSDTGQGISPEFLPFVFDRFRQADSSTTRAHGGLGLGLAIVRHLVELHGGTVHAESEGEDSGATFKVLLPVMAVSTKARDEDQMRQAGTPTPPNCPPLLTDLRVLVVDDEEDARALLLTVLEQCGASVMVVASASEALDALAEYRPDVLVSDIGMSGEDGYDLIRKVRALTEEEGGKLPAVALTAYAGEEDRKQALAAGFEMHLAKPVDPEELAAAISSLARSADKV